MLHTRNSFGYLKRPGSYDNDDTSGYYTYRVGGKERKGDVDYDLLIRLLLCLIYGTHDDSSMLTPAGNIARPIIFAP